MRASWQDRSTGQADLSRSASWSDSAGPPRCCCSGVGEDQVDQSVGAGLGHGQLRVVGPVLRGQGFHRGPHRHRRLGGQHRSQCVNPASSAGPTRTSRWPRCPAPAGRGRPGLHPRAGQSRMSPWCSRASNSVSCSCATSRAARVITPPGRAPGPQPTPSRRCGQPTEGLRGVDAGHHGARRDPQDRRQPRGGFLHRGRFPHRHTLPGGVPGRPLRVPPIEHVLGAPSERHTWRADTALRIRWVAATTHSASSALIAPSSSSVTLASSGQRERVRGLHRGHRRPTHALEHVAYSTCNTLGRKSYVDTVSNNSGRRHPIGSNARGRAKRRTSVISPVSASGIRPTRRGGRGGDHSRCPRASSGRRVSVERLETLCCCPHHRVRHDLRKQLSGAPTRF